MFSRTELPSYSSTNLCSMLVITVIVLSPDCYLPKINFRFTGRKGNRVLRVLAEKERTQNVRRTEGLRGSLSHTIHARQRPANTDEHRQNFVEPACSLENVRQGLSGSREVICQLIFCDYYRGSSAFLGRVLKFVFLLDPPYTTPGM